jgi:HEAT repeat protein
LAIIGGQAVTQISRASYTLIILIASVRSAIPCETPTPVTARAKCGITDLIKNLRNKDATTRLRAADRLAEIGPDGLDAAPALIEALGDKDEKVAASASIALSQIGEGAVPFLVTALDGENKTITARAMHVLYRIGPKARVAVPTLIRIMKEEKERSSRLLAMDVLARIKDKDSVTAFVDVISRERDQSIRCAAISTLSNFGPKAKEAVPILIAVMKSELSKTGPDRLGSITVGNAAAETLAFIGSDAVPPLADILLDAKSAVDVRNMAAYSLGEMPKYHDTSVTKPAIPALISALKDVDKDLRIQAASSLGEMGKHGRDAIAALEESLKDNCATVRINAADALCRIDQRNRLAIPALIIEIQSEDEKARDLATTSLKSLGEKAVPGLIRELQRGNVSSRLGAITGLKVLGVDAKQAIPALKETLDDPDLTVREAARGTLKSLQKE